MDMERLHIDIHADLQSDPMALEHLSSTTDPHWTTNTNGLLHCDNCIYVPDSSSICLHVLQYLHDHPLSGHFGQMKTLYQVRQHYTWPGLPEFVTDYCKSCTTCSCVKPQWHKPYGLLKQLPVPEKPWNSILMDFIEQLPLSSGYTSILVIVNCLSKQSLFILTHMTHDVYHARIIDMQPHEHVIMHSGPC